jgi:hypothetical protein
MNATAARTATQGIADFLRTGGDLTDLEREALAGLDRDEVAAIDRGTEALTNPPATDGTVETRVLFTAADLATAGAKPDPTPPADPYTQHNARFRGGRTNHRVKDTEDYALMEAACGKTGYQATGYPDQPPRACTGCYPGAKKTA